MASIGSGSIVIAGSPNVLVSNIVVPAAATEVSHVLQNNVTVLEFKAREDGVSLQWCFIEDDSDTIFMSLPACATQSFTGIKLSQKTLYVRASAACTIEIIEFYS